MSSFVTIGFKVLGRGFAGPDAHDEAAVFLDVLRQVLRVEGDRRIKIREEKYQKEIQRHIKSFLTEKAGLAIHCMKGRGTNCAIVAGKRSTDDAKMIGYNASLVHPERNVCALAAVNLASDYALFAYWTGMLL